MNDTRTMIQPRFMTVRQAAELLGVSAKSLYTWVSCRRVPFRKAGRRLLFLESELVEWTRPTETRRHGRRIR
jgi:excisionase family DNA binding protein